MTKAEKFQKAQADHKYALEYIKELEAKVSATRAIAISRLDRIRKYEPEYGVHKPNTTTDSYTESRRIQG